MHAFQQYFPNPFAILTQNKRGRGVFKYRKVFIYKNLIHSANQGLVVLFAGKNCE